jgi:MFS family permease
MTAVSSAFILIVPVALILGWIPGLGEVRDGLSLYLWISSGLIAGVFSQLVINLLLSQFILVVRKEEHWWRQYNIELTLILAAIPVIALLGAGVIAFAKFLRGEPPTPAP